MRLELVVWRQVLWLQTPLCSAGPITAAALHTTWYQQHWRPPTTSPAARVACNATWVQAFFFISTPKLSDETHRSRCIPVSPPAEPACCPWRRAAAAPETWTRSAATRSGWSCSPSRWASGRGWRRTWCGAPPCCSEGCRYSGSSPPARGRRRVKLQAGDTCPQCSRRGRVHTVQQKSEILQERKTENLKKYTYTKDINRRNVAF